MTDKKTNKKLSRKKWILILLAVCILAAIAAFARLKFHKKPSGTSNINIRTAQKMTIEKTIESEGEIESSLEENIAPHTSYYLKKMKVEEGDRVKKGATILTYTNGNKLKAPYDCVVESWNLPESGAQLTNEHYVTIAGTDVLMVQLSIDESDIAKVEVGTTAQVSVEATGQTYEGEVYYVSQKGNYSGGTSTFDAKVQFDNDGDVKLGMTGNAIITLSKAEDVLGVPNAAIHSGSDGSYVTVSKDDEGKDTTEVQIQTGLSNDSYTAVIAGLEEGAKVVVPQSEDNSSGFNFGGRMPGGGSGKMPGGEGFPGGNPGRDGSGRNSSNFGGSSGSK